MRTDALYTRALEYDQADRLRSYRDRFVLPPDIIYLDGNSLGAMPKTVKSRLAQIVESEWGQRLVRGWNEGWVELPQRLGAKVAGLIGADPDEVIVTDSTSINFYKLASAAAEYQKGREAVIVEEMGFPTNTYILERLFGRENFRLVQSEDGITIPPENVETSLGPDVAVMSLNHVNYRSGWLHDMTRLNAAAKEQGILNLWDLSHSVGVVPIDLHAAGVDLAVGCTYKYLNGGPGAPAFVYVRRELQNQLRNPIQGWFGHKDFFEFSNRFEPAEDVRRFLTGTPSILSHAAVEEGLDIVLEAGVQAIRKKSVAMTEYLIDIWRETLEPLHVSLNTPENPAHRGSHVSLGHERAVSIDAALITRMGVIPDFRKPDNIRFGISPIYNCFAEVYEAMERMRILLTDSSYQNVELLSGIVS